MAKPLKRAPKGHVQISHIPERRRVKAAGRFVTGLLTDMVDGQFNAPAAAERATGGFVPMLAALELADQTPAPLGLTADATDKLRQGARSFGDVLKDVGLAVVVSQAALDDAAIESAKLLSQTKLNVAVAIQQNLDDKGDIEGEPEADLRTLSLSSFILPTLHQWQHVAVSMDLTVGEIDATAGIKVKSGGVSAGVSVGAGGFSAAGEFNYSSLNAESRLRSDFSTGAVRFDALLGPREEFRFPEIADFAIGPQILVTQVAAAGPAVRASAPGVTPVVLATPAFRRVTLTIKILDKNGHPLREKSVEIRLPPDLRQRLISQPTGTIQLPADVTLRLDPQFFADPTQSYRIQLKYGNLVKMVDVVL